MDTKEILEHNTKDDTASINYDDKDETESPSGELRRMSIETPIPDEAEQPSQDSRETDLAYDQGNDVEAASTSESNGPSYTIFSKNKIWFIVFMASWAGFFSPLSASIYFPALNVLAKDLDVSSSLINLTLTSYMIFQGLAPMFVGDLADAAGRRPAYLYCFVVYIAACIGIALQNSFAALFVLRCLQSAGSSGTVALGMGVVADISTPGNRGTYAGWNTGGMLVAPAIGPVLGGILAQFLGWRAIFWFLVIMAGVFFVIFLVFFPETGRNVVGNGSIPPQGWNMSLLNYLAIRKLEKERPQLQRTESRMSARSQRETLAKKRKFRFPNPLHTLVILKEKDMALLLTFNWIIYVAFYDILASMPYLLEQIYGFNELQIGLCFIPYGVGALLAPVMNGRILDWNYRRVAKKAGITIDVKRGDSLANFPLERARIPVALPLVIIGNASVLCFGWVMEFETNLAGPLIVTFVAGLTITGAFNVMNVMLVDNYPKSPATATAANNLVRCLMGAGGTAVIIYMIEGMGRGWCFTFIAGVVLLSTSILFILMKWGPKWREERRVRLEAADEKKRQKQDSAS